MVCFMFGYLVCILVFGFGFGLLFIFLGMVGMFYVWLIYVVFVCWILGLIWLLIVVVGFVIGIWVCICIVCDLGVVDYGVMVWDEMVVFWFVLVFVMFIMLGG